MVSIDLATLCDSYSYVELKIAPIDTIWLILVLMEDLPATLWLPTTPPSIPLPMFVVLVIPVKNHLKCLAIQLAIHSILSP